MTDEPIPTPLTDADVGAIMTEHGYEWRPCEDRNPGNIEVLKDGKWQYVLRQPLAIHRFLGSL